MIIELCGGEPSDVTEAGAEPAWQRTATLRFARLAELAATEPLVASPAAAAGELQMAVQKLLEEHGPRRRMDELLRKAEDMGLNYDEKAELSLLLKSKSRPSPPS